MLVAGFYHKIQRCRAEENAWREVVIQVQNYIKR